MAASEAKGKGDASSPYIISLESSDDEEMHPVDVYKNQEFQSGSGKKINHLPLLWKNSIYSI